MFKAQVLRRSFSLFKRAPTKAIAKSAARDGHRVIQIQRVRFKQRFFTQSRIIKLGITATGVYASLWYLGHLLEDEEDEESRTLRRIRRRRTTEHSGADDEDGDDNDNDNDEEDADEDENDFEEEDEDDTEGRNDGLIFFPTGFSRPAPRKFYRSSDPEWREFVRLSKDRQRVNRIRGELVTMIRESVKADPKYRRALGKIDTERGAMWLEPVFPSGPPLEYERPGVELTENLTFRKATRPVHGQHHRRLVDLLMPTPVANALFVDSTRRLDQSWHNVKNYLGWGDKSSTPTAQQVLTQIQAPPPAAPPSTPEATSATPSDPTPTSSPATSSNQKTSTPPSSSAPLANPGHKRFGLALPDPTQAPTIDLSDFRQSFRANRRRTMIDPARGTCLFTGLVQVNGSQGTLTMDVIGVYDPRSGSWDHIVTYPRTIRPHRQHARGGP